ncbi:hypothetical protein OGATHE_001753, partial [Ogataea polymorpha]
SSANKSGAKREPLFYIAGYQEAARIIKSSDTLLEEKENQGNVLPEKLKVISCSPSLLDELCPQDNDHPSPSLQMLMSLNMLGDDLFMRDCLV